MQSSDSDCRAGGGVRAATLMTKVMITAPFPGP